METKGDNFLGIWILKVEGLWVRFKASRCKPWRTKRGGSWKSVGAFWGEIHMLEKHIK